MIWKTPSALIHNEWKNLMYNVFYAIMMMSMRVALLRCVFVSVFRVFVPVSIEIICH